MAAPSTSDELRTAWHEFFASRGHTVVPSASVIPVDPSVLFTVAGMVPFKPYFVGDEQAPYSRAVSIQKTIRAGGKHNDLDDIGRTNRHFSFFEMMGSFSFGDYFKKEAIRLAWEFVIDVLELDPSRLWATVHTSDDEAAALWVAESELPPERVVRLGDAENYWRMGDTGPCGPCSEIFYDLGAEYGPEGGPAVSEDRYIEFWNLVFMQFDQHPDGSVAPLPRPSIDTGAGLERMLAILQGKHSIFDIDVFRPLIGRATEVTGSPYGRDAETDVSLRILAEHARTMTVMVTDGVVPSNEDRGYVLRRIIRRAVRHAYRVGAREHVTPAMVEVVADVMGGAYPDIVSELDRVLPVIEREEERFLATLQRGLEMLDDLLGRGDLDGEDAFFLHDTLGFPIDLTREIAQERARSVDVDGFDALMADQRTRARAARRDESTVGAAAEAYREIVETSGPTEFTGRAETASSSRVVAVFAGRDRVARADSGAEVDVVLDRTPFYAESGGQIGDTGWLRADGDVHGEVLDTVFGLPAQLHVHRVRVTGAGLAEGDLVTAEIDSRRRDEIRRHHTATHLLHWALREVLGSSAQQAGSLVAPDRLRFDFSHHEAVSQEALDEIERLVNTEVLTDAPVLHYETSRSDASERGALAFFGEKYGDTVRVLEAGEHSVELCGGTHVSALGFIGPVKIVSEGSIGANLRRIEAVAGPAALTHIREEELTLREIGDRLRASPGELVDKIDRMVEQVKSLQLDVQTLEARVAAAAAGDLARGADDGVVITRRDGLTPDALRQLAQATLDALGSGIVGVLGANPDGTKAGLAVAVSADLTDRGVSAAEVARPAARALGGGTAKSTKLVVGGGPNVTALEEAAELLASSARAA